MKCEKKKAGIKDDSKVLGTEQLEGSSSYLLGELQVEVGSQFPCGWFCSRCPPNSPLELLIRQAYVCVWRSEEQCELVTQAY